MARRIYLHVGTPKTGTTYLQSLLWSNRRVLADLGVMLPLHRVADHFTLSRIARRGQGEVPKMTDDERATWQRMLDEVSEWPTDVVISHEMFALATPERARWTTDQLAAVGDVHPVITARDPARQLPAGWQQAVKQGRSFRLREFYEKVRAESPDIVFWRSQDLPYQVEMWSQALPVEQVHIVTVPPAGGPRDALWRRFASVLGIDPDAVDHALTIPNESLGLVEIEVLRRVNEVGPREGTKRLVRQPMVRKVLAESVLAGRPDALKFAPPEEEHPWVIEHGAAVVEQLRRLGCEVVGDLDDLLPPAEPVHGPVPDDVDCDDLLAVAIETIPAALFRAIENETAQVHNLKGHLERSKGRIQHLLERVDALERALDAANNRPVWRHAGLRTKATAHDLRGRLGSNDE